MLNGSQVDGALPAAGSSSEMRAMAPMSESVADADDSRRLARFQPEKQKQRVIYTGSMSLNCVSITETINKFKDKVKEFGGYVGSLSQTGRPGDMRHATFTARIPVANFQNFMTGLQSIGEMTDSSWDADDVSEEFYDSTARLKSKKVQEQRLIELLAKATGKLSEVLSVEKELARVREEIESMEGRLNYLTNQTDFSTVTVNLTEVREFRPEGPPSIPTQAWRAFLQSLDSVKEFLVSVVFFCIRSIPWLTFPLVVFIVYKIVARKRKPKGQFN